MQGERSNEEKLQLEARIKVESLQVLIVLLWALCSEVKISRYGTLTMVLDLEEMKTALIDCPFILTFSRI